MNLKNQDYILSFFTKNKKEAFSSSSLVSLFKEKMDRATVFRQLQKLEEKGLIKKNFSKEHDCYLFTYSCNCDSHLHLICDRCGKIVHLECEETNDFMNHLLTHHNFVINKSHSVIYGLCKDCKEVLCNEKKNI